MEKNNFERFKEFDNHKLILKIEDRDTGLKGFIAIHNDVLGLPVVGGTRMFPYASENDALVDVLRLSRAMTYKCAMAKVPHGGAKGVIIGDPKKDKTEKLLQSYAKVINSLHGKFCTGEDVGIDQKDVNTMLKISPYFIGKPEFAADPSPYAAMSTFYSMEGAVKYVYKKNSLKGISVAVKGVGKVGKALVQLLSDAGAKIFISDIDSLALKETKKKFPDVTIVENETVQSLGVDIFSPCALGNDFSMQNADTIKARIICGAANNQLEDQEIDDWLFRHNIVYIPDYVANAGGLIDVVDELEKGGYKKSRVSKRINKVKDTVKKILITSFQNNKSPHRIADQMAENYFKS